MIDYYTTHAPFSGASGVSIAAIGTIAISLQYAEVSKSTAKKRRMLTPVRPCRHSSSHAFSAAIRTTCGSACGAVSSCISCPYSSQVLLRRYGNRASSLTQLLTQYVRYGNSSFSKVSCSVSVEDFCMSQSSGCSLNGSPPGEVLPVVSSSQEEVLVVSP